MTHYIVINENEIVKAEMERPERPVSLESDFDIQDKEFDYIKEKNDWQNHCLSLPRIPAPGHKWEVWRQIELDKDFRLEEDYTKGTGAPTIAIPIQPTGYTKTMQELKNSPLGEAWDKIICVCRALLKDSPCDCNCKEFHDESLSNERSPIQPTPQRLSGKYMCSECDTFYDDLRTGCPKCTPQPTPEGEKVEERLFTLKEAIEIWKVGMEYGMDSMHSIEWGEPTSNIDRDSYFKEKFGIVLTNDNTQTK